MLLAVLPLIHPPQPLMRLVIPPLQLLPRETLPHLLLRGRDLLFQLLDREGVGAADIVEFGERAGVMAANAGMG